MPRFAAFEQRREMVRKTSAQLPQLNFAKFLRTGRLILTSTCSAKNKNILVGEYQIIIALKTEVPQSLLRHQAHHLFSVAFHYASSFRTTMCRRDSLIPAPPPSKAPTGQVQLTRTTSCCAFIILNARAASYGARGVAPPPPPVRIRQHVAWRRSPSVREAPVL